MPGSPSIQVKATGPLLEGKDAAIVKKFLDELLQQIGQQAFANVHHELDRNLKHPTPYYETQIINERVANDQVIHDRGIVYGPWLEGTSPRNQTTRFHGYHSFESAQKKTDKEVPRLAQATLKKYLGRM